MSRPSSPWMVPENCSMVSACGSTTMSTSTGWPTAGRPASSNFTCRSPAPALPVTTPPTRFGDSESAGLTTFLTVAALAALAAAAESSLEPHPKVHRASSRTRLVARLRMRRARYQRSLSERTCGIGISGSSLARIAQQRRVVDHFHLLEQVLQVPLPVALLGEPGKGARKGRIAPAMRDPGGMMEHPQPPQRLDEPELAQIEVCELPVAFEELRPLVLLLIGRPRKHHPQILHARPHEAVVEIDEGGPPLVPQEIAEMAVTVQTNGADLSHRGKSRRDPLEQRAAHRGIACGEPLGQELAREHVRACVPTESLDTQARTHGESAQRPHLMQAREAPPQELQRLRPIELRGAASHPGKTGETELVIAHQRLTPEMERSGHRELCGCQLAGELVLLEDLCVAPARRPVELEHQDAALAVQLVDAVLVAIEREQPSVGVESDRRGRVQHHLGGEPVEGLQVARGAFAYHRSPCVIAMWPKWSPWNAAAY